MSFERHFTCWRMICEKEKTRHHCDTLFLDCLKSGDETDAWKKATKAFTTCTPKNYEFGLFADAFNDQVTSAGILDRYFYCLWWGLRNLRYVELRGDGKTEVNISSCHIALFEKGSLRTFLHIHPLHYGTKAVMNCFFRTKSIHWV